MGLFLNYTCRYCFFFIKVDGVKNKEMDNELLLCSHTAKLYGISLILIGVLHDTLHKIFNIYNISIDK